ncbi:MAG: hypothetical protein PHE84_07790 [bacterium]|nr:hypothetical protein [bacterium]
MLNFIIAAAANTTTPEVCDIIQKVDAFYNSSWNHLLYIIIIMFGIVGIVVPLFIQWIQTKNFKEEKEDIKNTLESNITNKLKDQLNVNVEQQNNIIQSNLEEFGIKIEQSKELLKTELKDIVEKTRFDLEKQINDVFGGVFFVQGTMLLAREIHKDSTDSFLAAGIYYCQCDTESNLVRVIDILKDRCFPKLNKKLIEDDPNFQKQFEKLIKAINDINKSGRYTDDINLLRKLFREALQK